MTTQPLSSARYNPWNRYRLMKQVSRTLMHAVGILLSALCFLPFIVSVSASFTEEKALSKNGYGFYPPVFSAAAYDLILKVPQDILRSYAVTFFVMILGTILSLLVMAPFAYALSRRDFGPRKFFAFYVFFTMVFSGGLVPWYILIKQYLHLADTLWVMIVPFLVNGFTLIILRSSFAALPQEILDAARIDGAGEWRILTQIAVPMAAPTLAAMGIFIALGFWNTYYPALLFINDRKLYPLQYLLYIIQTNMQMFTANPNVTGISVPTISLRYAMVVLIGFPVLFFTLFFQKYFVKGVYLGGIKE